MKRVLFAAPAVILYSSFSSSLMASRIAQTGYDFDRTMGLFLQLDGQEYVAAAGIANLNVDGEDGLQSVCANIFKGISVMEEYEADSLSAFSYADETGARSAWLLETYLPAISSAVEGAALQLSVWKVLHDGGSGFDQGHIQANEFTDTAVLDLATLWIAESRGRQGDEARVFVPVTGGIDFQEQLYLGSSSGSEVPEPGAMGMIALAGLGLAVARRGVA